jgi:hypothetical protein
MADTLVRARRCGGLYTWGLRQNLFLFSYNPSSGSNRAYFDFGVAGRDIPFYLNPAGKSDWFVPLRPQGDEYQVIMMLPFSKVSRTINVGKIQDGSHPPLPLQQDDRKARTLEEAILWHDGEASAAQARFTQLSAPERDALITFLHSL